MWRQQAPVHAVVAIMATAGNVARSRSCGTTTTTEDKSECTGGPVTAPQVRDATSAEPLQPLWVALADHAGAVGRSEEVSAITVDNVGCKRRQGPR